MDGNDSRMMVNFLFTMLYLLFFCFGGVWIYDSIYEYEMQALASESFRYQESMLDSVIITVEANNFPEIIKSFSEGEINRSEEVITQTTFKEGVTYYEPVRCGVCQKTALTPGESRNCANCTNIEKKEISFPVSLLKKNIQQNFRYDWEGLLAKKLMFKEQFWIWNPIYVNRFQWVLYLSGLLWLHFFHMMLYKCCSDRSNGTEGSRFQTSYKMEAGENPDDYDHHQSTFNRASKRSNLINFAALNTISPFGTTTNYEKKHYD